MRYVLAGSVVIVGLVLIGLAYHNTAAQAWAALRSGTPGPRESSTNEPRGPTEAG